MSAASPAPPPPPPPSPPSPPRRWPAVAWLVARWAFWALTRPVVWPVRLVLALLLSFRFWLLVIVAGIGCVVAYFVMADRVTPLTSDAYVQAYVVQLAPQVPGRVVRVHVGEGQEVKRGRLLYELDRRPFEHRVKLLEAKLVQARQQVRQLKTDLAIAGAERTRLKAEAEVADAIHRQDRAIFKRDAIPERRYIESQGKAKVSRAALDRSDGEVRRAEEALEARIAGEHALVAQVQAELEAAQLDLSYTVVYSPCDGAVTDVQLREGAYLHAGQAALAIIDTSRWVIVANFRENCLAAMRPGQPALVALRSVPGRQLPARVESIGAGVAGGQGAPSGQLPAVKRQTSWVQPAQRFQVRLVLDEQPPVPFRVGQTASVSVYTDPDEERLTEATRMIHLALAYLDYL